MFQALSPKYEKTGEMTHGADGKPIHWYAVKWVARGIVETLTEAREKYGRNIVLEHIGRVH